MNSRVANLNLDLTSFKGDAWRRPYNIRQRPYNERPHDYSSRKAILVVTIQGTQFHFGVHVGPDSD